MGSKNRIAKYILPIMLKYRKPNQYWVEPFVGGANMIDKVDGKRIGGDNNYYCIEALTSIRDYANDLPKNNLQFTEEDYKKLRFGYHKFKGYLGFACSYGGKWLGGWRRDNVGNRDYVAESYRSAIKQSFKIQGIVLQHSEYNKLDIPKNSLIYCDPPYQHTTKYNSNFNHDDFWKWCRIQVKNGHTVFVSEYNAPSDFICVWEKQINSSLTKDTGSKKGMEKLFIHKTQYNNNNNLDKQ